GFLHVQDSRTDKLYDIPISRNAVLATDLKQIKAIPSMSSEDKAHKVSGGLRVHDPGLQNTTVVETSTSFADSDRGILLLRGYALEQLWDAQYEDMLHLMVWGKYPTASQSESLRLALATLMREVPQGVFDVIQRFPRDGPLLPMVLAGLSVYLAVDETSIPAYNGGNIYHNNPQRVDKAILTTVAAYAVAIGVATSHRKGIAFTPPSIESNYWGNLFLMMGLADPATGKLDAIKFSCFRRFAALNSDHGMALSSYTMLTATSGLADPISGVIASLAASYGPLHYGAPECAYRSLKQLSGPQDVPNFLDEVKKGHRRLFGYGHRTYKTVDPRLPPIKEMLRELSMETDPMFQIAKEIDRISSEDEYFVKRGLHANADFYGVFVFTGCGFAPEEIPIVMLAQRLVGVMAHWREAQMRSIKLFRPTHIYTGDTEPIQNFSVTSKL
ncbi:hypothetical protein CERZMDRAFT_34664, partial [Cercospora zeae-maydis SCOH1-5]